MDRTDHLRDGALAVAVLAGLLSRLRQREAVDAVADPVAAVTGVGGALVVEWAFLRYPERLLALWDRPAVGVGSATGLLVAARAADRSRLAAAGVWGLLTYLVILASVLVGRGNPLAALRSGN